MIGRIGIVLAAVLAATPAFGGPPYVTDDPAPTDLGKWENYAFVAGTRLHGVTEGATGIDINYGGAEDLQLTFAVPLEYEDADSLHAGLGDIELAAKYRFLRQDGVGLDVAFFPRVFLPTADRHGEAKHANLLLPLWLGREAGGWSVFGGGGYQVNPGAGNRDFWVSGLAVTRDVDERLNLGAEIYHQSPDVDGGEAFTGVNLGAVYRLSRRLSILASGGPGVQNADSQGRWSFYMSLKADY